MATKKFKKNIRNFQHIGKLKFSFQEYCKADLCKNDQYINSFLGTALLSPAIDSVVVKEIF